MNNHIKHTHTLSKEELLDLLEHKDSQQLIDMDALDDFEKEALEGFSAHTNSAQAKALMDEIDFSIAQKLTSIPLVIEESNSSKKKTGLWLSIAASVALIVGLSVLFLKQAGVETEKNVALNTNIPKTESVNEPVMPADAAPALPQQPEQKQLSDASVKAKEFEVATTLNESPKYNNGQEVSSTLYNYKKEDASATGSTQMPVTKTTADMELKPVEEKEAAEVATLYSKESNVYQVPVAASVPATMNNESFDLAKDEKAIAGVASQAKMEAKKSKVARSEADDADKFNAVTSQVAYYKGGEKAIKKFVVDYEKTKPFSQKLHGTFIVNALSKANGTIHVTSVKPHNAADAIYNNYLTEALNSSTGWIPATQNGTAIETPIEFKLEF